MRRLLEKIKRKKAVTPEIVRPKPPEGFVPVAGFGGVDPDYLVKREKTMLFWRAEWGRIDRFVLDDMSSYFNVGGLYWKEPLEDIMEVFGDVPRVPEGGFISLPERGSNA